MMRPDAAASLRESMDETLTLMRLGISGQLAKDALLYQPLRIDDRALHPLPSSWRFSLLLVLSDLVCSPERSQRERTRQEGRRSKFYEVSDNLAVVVLECSTTSRCSTTQANALVARLRQPSRVRAQRFGTVVWRFNNSV